MFAYHRNRKETIKMKLGYARISTREQDLTIQEESLKTAGCERIFTETASGGRWERPELQRLLDHLREGDIVVVHKLDRLTRSLKDLLTILEKLRVRKAGFQSLTENFDTTTAGGVLMMQMIGSFAEFERSLIKERTHEGIQRARSQGRFAGRPSKLSAEQKKEVLKCVEKESHTQAELARLFGVKHSVINRLVTKERKLKM